MMQSFSHSERGSSGQRRAEVSGPGFRFLIGLSRWGLALGLGVYAGLGLQAAESPARTSAARPDRSFRNLALNRQCTFTMPPDYHLCTDTNDARQITDGQHTEGYFWGQKSTVGWSTPDPGITIDLGTNADIIGAALYTAGCAAGVEWMDHIYVLASEDGTNFYLVGDLMELSREENGAPPVGVYTQYCFNTTGLQTHGRFIGFVAQPQKGKGACFFVDEIEVYGQVVPGAKPQGYDGELFQGTAGFVRANSRYREFWNREPAVTLKLLAGIAGQCAFYQGALSKVGSDPQRRAVAAALQKEWDLLRKSVARKTLPEGYWRLVSLVDRTEDFLAPILLEKLGF